MKKKLALILGLSLILMAFIGCGPKENNDLPVDVDGDVSTGMAVITSIAKSVDAADEDGTAQVDSVIVGVTVDADGRIVNCAIDSVETKIDFSKEGMIVTPSDAVFAAKQELGEDYGLIKNSSIGKEWNEQATALSNYVIGKTIDEVKGIAINEKGVPTDAELAASVTISIGNYIDAIEKAVGNVRDLGSSADDMIGIGVISTVDNSFDAKQDMDGLAQAYTNFAVATFDANGVITGCIIDASQTDVNFTADGKITTDLDALLLTKNELGDAYNMRATSAIGKEWFEQADAFARYAAGKTVDSVKGTALDEEGRAGDVELASSVSVRIGPFMTVIEKAYAAAK
jgi:hypothetical protein